jgi:signal transduction histidine kinase
MIDTTLILALLGGFIAGGLVVGLGVYFRTQRSVESRATQKLQGKQEAFIAIASHYLLTPISIIQSAITRLIEKPAMPLPARQELYDVILSGEKRLYIIAEQMLLATKLVNGELALNLRVTQLHEPVINAIREIEAIARQKHAVVRPQIQQTPAIELQVDPKLVQVATVAVLDNAVKFSQEGGQIEISVKRDGNWGLVTVTDQGIGLNAEQQAHATEKFYRGTPPYSFDYQGMGLGLHVAYVIMEAHGGELIINSKGENRGASVTLKWPLNA